MNFTIDQLGRLTPMANGTGDHLGNAPGAATPVEDYLYDPLYRLETVQDDQSANIEAYSYDLIGNRQSKAKGSFSQQLYHYATSSHRLTAVGGNTRSYDAAGNLVADQSGSRSYTYGDHNRLTNFSRSGSYSGSYTYNGRGERVAKYSNVPGGGSDSRTTRASSTWSSFIYDEAGRLLAEHSVNQPSPPDNNYRSYVYLDDIPVGVIGVDGNVYYIHADHLGTPRAVTDDSGTKRWEWEFQANPFGEKQPDEHDEVTGYPFTLNLRYPGQYYDAESGLHYNYFRDYEPGIGRYVQSDPISLIGGLSTYEYADGNPLIYFDRFGLFPDNIGPDRPKEPLYRLLCDGFLGKLGVSCPEPSPAPIDPVKQCKVGCNLLGSAGCTAATGGLIAATKGAGAATAWLSCQGGKIYLCKKVCEPSSCE